MNVETINALETDIIRFIEGDKQQEAHSLPEIVKRFRSVSDDATIKAALLKLNVEGLVEITPNWEFRSSSSTLS